MSVSAAALDRRMAQAGERHAAWLAEKAWPVVNRWLGYLFLLVVFVLFLAGLVGLGLLLCLARYA